MIVRYRQMGCWLSLIITIVCSLFLMMGNASSSEQNSAETPDLSEPHQSSSVSMLTRLNSGFINIATGPLELVNQPRQEIKRTNFLFEIGRAHVCTPVTVPSR